MKKIIVVLLIISFQSFGQTPQGKLLVHCSSSTPSKLAYFDFLSATPVIFDTIELTDMIQMNNTLFVADNDVYAYDLVSLQKTDTITGIFANKLEKWNNNLIVLSTAAPYFRVFNITTHNLIFSLNVSKVPMIPNDVAVSANKAFLVYDSTLQIVDLLIQDTLATLPTPHPFPFGGINYFVFPVLNEIYIDVEYATGAPRFSLLKLDQTNMIVDTVFHHEMDHNSAKPVVSNNIIYLAHFLSFYDVITDSLIIAPYNASFVVDLDPSINILFVYNPLYNTISTYSYNTLIQTYNLPGWLNMALFVPAIPTEINDTRVFRENIRIFPNPFTDALNIEGNGEGGYLKISMYDLNGNRLLYSIADSRNEIIKLKTANIRDGIYFLVIENDHNILFRKMVKMKIY